MTVCWQRLDKSRRSALITPLECEVTLRLAASVSGSVSDKSEFCVCILIELICLQTDVPSSVDSWWALLQECDGTGGSGSTGARVHTVFFSPSVSPDYFSSVTTGDQAEVYCFFSTGCPPPTPLPSADTLPVDEMMTESTMLFARIKSLIVHHSSWGASMRLQQSRLIICSGCLPKFSMRFHAFFFVWPCFPRGLGFSQCTEKNR